ncbi:MAG: MMPL family transporter [Thermoleophilaceae bacterium]|nr:MMPL family transporter [Thermoleophilaceae bacterium]
MSARGRPRRNLAARAGAFSALHWKRAAFGWLAFAIAAVLLGGAVGGRSLSESEMASGEAAKAERILDSAGFTEPATESVLIQTRDGAATARDPQFAAVIAKVTRTLSRQPEVTNIRDPLKRPRSLISADLRSALVQFDMRGGRDNAPDKVQPILDAVAAVQQERPQFRIEEFGSASAMHVTDETIGEDFRRAERLSLPITLLVLLFAFGALVAASVPVLLAFSAVLAALGLSTFVSYLVPTADATQSVILLIGMAVGVDYSLFYLRRAREERAAGNDSSRALLRAAGTSGQAVLVSGATVLVAMAGMLFAGAKIFTSIGVGAMIVVFAAMVGSLTVLPAILHKLGDRVERGRVPLVGRLRRPAGESRLWGAILRPVLRWPAAAALVSAGVLVAAAVPTLEMHTKLPSFTDLPRSVALVATYERIQRAFPGSQTPAEVVVKADRVTAPAYRQAYREFRRRALRTGLLFRPFHVFVNRDQTVGRIEFAIAGSGADATSYEALSALRDDVVAPIAARLPGAEVAVTGETAATHDANETMKSRAPLVFAFVLGLAFLLLLLTFRSIVVPLKAILLNLLSVGAAYGVLIMVFQWGNLEGPLGFHSNGAIASWLPLFLFVVLFGLSMDYHVFILSRIKELVDRGMPTAQAVERGIRTTAGTVTAAATVMVAVFAIFAGLREISVKQMGFSLAVAVLIDATIIRAVLLPSTMKLLGEWNWYLPRWLQWLPSLAAGGAEPKEAAPAPGAAVPVRAAANGTPLGESVGTGSSTGRKRPPLPVG